MFLPCSTEESGLTDICRSPAMSREKTPSRIQSASAPTLYFPPFSIHKGFCHFPILPGQGMRSFSHLLFVLHQPSLSSYPIYQNIYKYILLYSVLKQKSSLETCTYGSHLIYLSLSDPYFSHPIHSAPPSNLISPSSLLSSETTIARVLGELLIAKVNEHLSAFILKSQEALENIPFQNTTSSLALLLLPSCQLVSFSIASPFFSSQIQRIELGSFSHLCTYFLGGYNLPVALNNALVVIIPNFICKFLTLP